MSCKQLGGACDKTFQAETFGEMAQLSKAHGMAMFAKGDEAHIKAMEQMKETMNDPEAMKSWFEGMRKEFTALPDDK